MPSLTICSDRTRWLFVSPLWQGCKGQYKQEKQNEEDILAWVYDIEHFGNCEENIDFVIETLKEVVEVGADVINLPNTVERFRIKPLVDMVEKVYKALGDKAIISVHHHNDLGMSTASTVESYFAGATQLECSLNGLGERCGNTNMYEVAIVLHNSGIESNLNLDKICDKQYI